MSAPDRPLPRWRACCALLLAGTAAIAGAQEPSPPPTLAQALEAAWALSPPARALAHRQAEFDARQRAAGSLLASPPSLTLAQRSDRVGTNQGLREYEAELGLPLWSPAVRSASAARVAAERAAFDHQQRLARLTLASELRELVASAEQAALERTLAARRHEEARVLADDVQRRVASGDTARVDALQARALERQAAAQRAQADNALAQVQDQWRARTGLDRMPRAEETPGTPEAGHPVAAARLAEVQATQARLALADADRRDPVELGVGVTRERAATGSAAESALRLSLRIPFGGDNRNAPRRAAAQAELDAAQAEFEAAQRQTPVDIASRRSALAAARQAQSLAAERAALAAEAQALIAKSYQLGESDLPARLRADNERFDADLALARARSDVQRAIARLNQSLGLLP
ncbi:MAG TPA: TolC family protein [Burkholderiaceae bacterium]